MARILVTTLPHEGHLNPTLSISAELRKRGHEILYLGHPLINSLIKTQGFNTVKHRQMGFADLGILVQIMRLRNSRGENEMRQAIKLFTMRLLPQVKYVNKIINNFLPDIVINDSFHYAGSLAAEISGVPWVNCWTAGVMHPEAKPNLFPIEKSSANDLMKLFDIRYNRVRQKLGLVEKSAGEFLKPSPWLQLYMSCKEVEPELPYHYPTSVYIGPCVSERKEKHINNEEIWDDNFLNYPLVYVSFGTFFNRNRKLLKCLIKVAENQKIRMLISTPLCGIKVQSKNVVLLNRVPQQQILKECSLFITHGGNNSVQESLLAGVPMLVMPVAGEQIYNANRVKWLGVGDIVDVNKMGVDELRQKIFSFIRSDEVKAKTQYYKQRLSQYRASEHAANLVEEILATGKPVSV